MVTCQAVVADASGSPQIQPRSRLRERYTRLTMAGTRSSRTLLIVVVGALVVGCSPTASTSPSASAATSPPAAPSLQSSAAGLVLQRTGPIGCDTIGIDYKSATIKIDAASDPDVWAETDTGKKLAVNWTDGFSATDGSAPVIRGPKGEEVARNGTVIDLPADGSYPRLVGYFVCTSTDALYVLETDPQ
jgi:hypothetical protein